MVHSSAVYIDLELTCWDGPPAPGRKPEIIEIGAVEMNLSDLTIVREAAYLIRPRHLDVSTRCTNLTGIVLQDLRSAPRFSEALARFVSDFTPGEKLCCCWGRDADLLRAECRECHTAFPLRNVMDVGQLFWHLSLLKLQPSLQNAVAMMDLAFVGVPHTALADARNTALVHAAILRRQRRQAEPIVQGANPPVGTPRSTLLAEKLGPVLASFPSLPQCAAPGSKSDR